MQEEKQAVSPKALIGISAAAVVVIVGLVVYFLHGSDPAARGPIPYQKIDYGAHMQQQLQEYGQRQRLSMPNPSRTSPPTVR